MCSLNIVSWDVLNFIIRFLTRVHPLLSATADEGEKIRGGLHRGPLRANELWSSCSEELGAITERKQTQTSGQAHTDRPRHLCPIHQTYPAT